VFSIGYYFDEKAQNPFILEGTEKVALNISHLLYAA